MKFNQNQKAQAKNDQITHLKTKEIEKDQESEKSSSETEKEDINKELDQVKDNENFSLTTSHTIKD